MTQLSIIDKTVLHINRFQLNRYWYRYVNMRTLNCSLGRHFFPSFFSFSLSVSVFLSKQSSDYTKAQPWKSKKWRHLKTDSKCRHFNANWFSSEFTIVLSFELYHFKSHIISRQNTPFGGLLNAPAHFPLQWNKQLHTNTPWLLPYYVVER